LLLVPFVFSLDEIIPCKQNNQTNMALSPLSISQPTPVAVFSADADVVYDELKKQIDDDDDFSLVESMSLLFKIIRLVENVSKDSGDHGAAKKGLALHLLRRISQDLDKSGRLAPIVDTLAGSMIDALISADRGQLLRDAHSRFKSIKRVICCSGK